jgi:dTDP-glucose pyrophosphorylase
MEKNILTSICLDLDSNLSDAIRNLEDSGIQLVIVLDDKKKLAGLITDGDIRRGLLKGFNIDSSVKEIMKTNPIIVDESVSREKAIQLMQEHKIKHLPVVDKNNSLLNLYLFDEELVSSKRENTFVIMAGGFGKRLMPHTENCPKPMLQIEGKPILEHILDSAISQGFMNFVISVYYLPDVIKNYFKDGSSWGVNIEYIQEDSPLGTAGALSLLSSKTNLRYKEMLEFHEKNNSTATMAVRNHTIQNPYGVVKTEDIDIIGFEEKPILYSVVNAGIYVLEPTVLNYLNNGEVCDMPVLFERLNNNNCRTVVFPMHEKWLDIGKPDDLELANSHISIT